MIAYRVVGVPERFERGSALAQQVGGDLVIDVQHAGAFPNHLAALASAGDATHVVVLEDDAIVCADFPAHVERLVTERPTHLLGLYVGRVAPRKPQPALAELATEAPAWLDHPNVTDALRWAVGYVMPTADVPAVLEALEAGGQHPWLDTDKRLGRWHAERGRLSYPFPSPVDHDDDLPSTTSTHRRGRRAWAHCERSAA